MRKTKTQRGITLIALIITILVLLILAVVAINAVKGDGIINHAKNAVTEYETAKANEDTILQNYSNILNKTKEYKEYSIGDTVTIGTESFYVIENSPKTRETVLLLAKECIDTTNLVQSVNATEVKFCEGGRILGNWNKSI